MAYSTTYPPGQVSLLGQYQLAENRFPHISYVGRDGTKFYLTGPLAPVAGAQNGVVMIGPPTGLAPPFQHLDNAGARQDGTTWFDALYDPGEIDLPIEITGITTADTRAVIRSWIGAWDAKQRGRLHCFTPENGEWWAQVRQLKTPTDPMIHSYENYGKQRFNWTARNDDAFWVSFDAVDQFVSASGSAFLNLPNRGDQDAWPRYLCYGPGTFTFSDGPNLLSPRTVTFGPLLAGQIALITTLPRLRGVVDLSPSQPAQTLTQFQTLMQQLISFATNNNVPPLLQQFESLFGILPPQGSMYSLLAGRFTTAIPAKVEGLPPVPANIAVTISGGDSNTKIVGAVTPQRRWPL
jgi:hypothetical protein